MFHKVLVDLPDLFVFREEPLDAVEDLFGPSYFISLRNFDLNRATLKPAHAAALAEYVVGFVSTRVGFAEIYAMTDRSSTRDVNFKVSAGRLAAVQQHLHRLNAPHQKVYHAYAKSVGEDFFEYRYVREKDQAFSDGRKDPLLRSIAIGLTPAPIGVPSRYFRNRTIAEVLSFGRQYESKTPTRSGRRM